MLIEDAGIPILVNRVENHAEVKPIILDLIDKMPNNATTPKVDCVDNISKTDWNLPKDYPRDYWKVIEPIINNTVCRSMFKYFKYEEIEIGNHWFQQYKQSDTHGWHVHSGCHWINVYLIELPDKHIKTQIADFKRTRILDYDAEEGDIISFPSMLFHRSPPNMTMERKTIVSFNLNVLR